MSLDEPKENASFLIIGAGAWGLALATLWHGSIRQYSMGW